MYLFVNVTPQWFGEYLARTKNSYAIFEEGNAVYAIIDRQEGAVIACPYNEATSTIGPGFRVIPFEILTSTINLKTIIKRPHVSK